MIITYSELSSLLSLDFFVYVHVCIFKNQTHLYILIIYSDLGIKITKTEATVYYQDIVRCSLITNCLFLI